MNNNRNARRVRNPKRKRGFDKKSNYLVINKEPRVERVNLRTNLSPDELRVTLRYNEQFFLTSTTGAGVSYTFRGNGPFDPDATGTGNQPTAYDQWSALFLYQRTLGSRIRIRGTPSATTGAVMALAVAPLPGASTVSVTSDLSNLKSQKFAKWDQATLYDKAMNLVQSCSTSQIFGKSVAAIESDDTFSSSIGSTPAQQWIWQIGVQELTGVTESIYLSVEVDYDIVFWARAALSQS